MTITLQAVNELIASLESAGELSIKERKYLELAKEFRICSTSLDAVIRTGNALADQNAQLAAENAALKESRNNLAEFIHEELDADYPLNMNLETPATDRIVAGIKADVVEEFAKYIALYNSDAEWHAVNFAKQLREGGNHD